jgi:NAD(P)-dependent dehydrogenase (short-subunit alcohol dehydrogenase family)
MPAELEKSFTDIFASTAMRGKGCVITGAAGGMGRAVATRFAQAGAAVVITDVLADGLEETRELIERTTYGAAVKTVVADVGDDDVADLVIGAAAASLEKITTLVNCAGIAVASDGPETLREWRKIMRTNLDSIYLLSSAAVPHLRTAGGGAIVNIASIIAHRSYRHSGDHFAYPASKSGVLGLTQSMAIKLGKDSVRVNAISPGFIQTRLGTWLEEGVNRLNAINEGIPIGIIGQPDDIAAAALFLASDASRYITGSEIVIDGGMSVEVGWDRFVS